eukprot:766740-Hanusia_phi.AAC.1
MHRRVTAIGRRYICSIKDSVEPTILFISCPFQTHQLLSFSCPLPSSSAPLCCTSSELIPDLL